MHKRSSRLSSSSQHIVLADVARAAGVSIKTASRVINNSPNVSDQVRERTWETIEKLGYVARGKALKGAGAGRASDQKTGNIGCVLFPTYSKFAEPTFAEILDEVHHAISAKGLHCYFIHTLGELEDRSLYLRVINPAVVDGVIMIGTGEKYRNRILSIKRRIPAIILSDFLEGNDVSCVYADGVQAARDATSYLLSLGHKRIACITGFLRNQPYNMTWLQGYKRALREAGLRIDRNMIREGRYNVPDAQAAMHALIREANPTAVYCTSDTMALGACNAIRQAGLRIGRDISVIGSGNIHLCQNLEPPLASMGINWRELSDTALGLLLEEINHTRTTPVRLTFPMTLYPRASCNEPAAADNLEATPAQNFSIAAAQ